MKTSRKPPWNKKRFQVRGPHPGPVGGYGKWTVVDTQDRDITVDVQRRRADAAEVARELNAKETNDVRDE